MLDAFNTRELALFIWVAAFIIWMLMRTSTRTSLLGVIRAAFAKKLSMMYIGVVLYTLGMVYFLYRMNLWEKSQLKNTIFWFFTVGFISLFDVTNDKKENYLKIAIKDIFSYTAVLQFIVGVYTFNFFIELLLVPIGVLVVGMIAFGQRDPKHASVVKLLNNLLALFGVYLFGYTIYRIAKDFHSFANTGTLSDFLIPATLSLLYLPFVYLLSLYVCQEDTFTGLDRHIKSPKLFRLAKWQTLLHFTFNKKELRRWRGTINQRDLKTKDDVKASIHFIKELKAIEKSPPAVPHELGWSPYKATEFLASFGLTTRYYHPYYDYDEWGASSPSIDIKGSKYLDCISYCVEGNRTTAKKLTLMLNVYSAKDAALSLLTFIAHVKTLYKAAMSKDLPTPIENAIQKLKNAEITEGNRLVGISVDKWPEHKRKGYAVKFEIQVATAS